MKKLFKKQQKKINQYVKQLNNELEQDDAFLGRIYLRQYSSGIIPYSDGSGALWVGVIRVYDKVTNTYKSILGDYYEVVRNLHREVNDFIINDLKIDVRRALALAVDYRDVKHNPREAEPFYPYYDKNFSYKRYQM